MALDVLSPANVVRGVRMSPSLSVNARRSDALFRQFVKRLMIRLSCTLPTALVTVCSSRLVVCVCVKSIFPDDNFRVKRLT